MRRRRGFLAVVLPLLCVLLVLGLGYLSRVPAHYRSANSFALAEQARALAVAGLEDCRLKLLKDEPAFPPASQELQVFTYVDDVKDTAGAVVGSYSVTIDSRWRTPPWDVLRISSEGTLGPPDAPLAKFVIAAMLDTRTQARTGTGSNPQGYQWIEWNELLP